MLILLDFAASYLIQMAWLSLDNLPGYIQFNEVGESVLEISTWSTDRPSIPPIPLFHGYVLKLIITTFGPLLD